MLLFTIVYNSYMYLASRQIKLSLKYLEDLFITMCIFPDFRRFSIANKKLAVNAIFFLCECPLFYDVS